MVPKSTWFQRFLHELMPVLYGIVAAVIAIGGLVVAILIYEHRPLEASPPKQLQAPMFSASRQPSVAPKPLLAPPETIRPALPANQDSVPGREPAPAEPMKHVPVPAPVAPITAAPVPAPAPT